MNDYSKEHYTNMMRKCDGIHLDVRNYVGKVLMFNSKKRKLGTLTKSIINKCLDWYPNTCEIDDWETKLYDDIIFLQYCLGYLQDLINHDEFELYLYEYLNKQRNYIRNFIVNPYLIENHLL